MRGAVDGITCIRPEAPACDVRAGRYVLSCLATARIRYGSMPVSWAIFKICGQ